MDRETPVLLDAPPAEPVEVEAEPDVGLDAMLSIGVTYRRLDYWTRIGYLRTTTPGTRVGSGQHRRWTVADFEVAYLMAVLTASGMTLSAAARYARDAVTLRTGSLSTEHGVRISLPRPPAPPQEADDAVSPGQTNPEETTP